jgi:hypothetical protein
MTTPISKWPPLVARSKPGPASEHSLRDTIVGAATIVFLVAFVGYALIAGGMALFGDGDGGNNPWDTCEGYRADVEPGSAQDTRDIRNGSNPC